VRPLVRPLIRLGVRPNQVTALHLVVGLAVIGAVASGSSVGLIWAGFGWLVSCLLDRLDGELARIGDMCSEAGHKFDCFVDTTLSSLFFLGLGVGLRNQPHGWVAVTFGVVACISQLTLNQVAEAYDSTAGVDGKILASRWGFDADDGLYLLGPLLWLPASFRFGATALAAMATLGFLMLFVSRLTRLRRQMAAPIAPAE
jgi:archaetidylinositol phosphate synthase